MNKVFQNFTNQYQVQKTLRFSLLPYKETAERLENFKSQNLQGIVKEDKERDKKYKQIKKVIDDYHREYINKKLKNVKTFITKEDIEKTFDLYKEVRKLKSKKTKEEAKEAEKVSNNFNIQLKNLRKSLIKSFSDKKSLFDKKLFTEILPQWIAKKEEVFFENKDYSCESAKGLISDFNKWGTYFTGFNENRKNVYTGEEKSTSIAYRTINENLIKFFDNLIIFQNLAKDFSDLGFSEVEKNFSIKLQDIFSLKNFLETVRQEGIDNYNLIIGGKSLEDGSRERGVNEIINEYKPQNKGEKAKKLPKFKELSKQILSERISNSYVLDGFDNDKQMFDAIKDFEQDFGENFFDEVKEMFSQFDKYDHGKIYLMNDNKLKKMSSMVFGYWSAINNLLDAYNYDHKTKLTDGNILCLGDLKTAMDYFQEKSDDKADFKGMSFDKIVKFYKTLQITQDIETNKKITVIENILEKKKLVAEIFALERIDADRQIPKDEKDKGGEGFEQIDKLKKYLDSYKDLEEVMKIFYLIKDKKKIDKPSEDLSFYNYLEPCFEKLSLSLDPLYNQCRNYLTQKPYKTDKFKINFQNVSLLGGWDKNKEEGNTSLLFIKDNKYYLGIMNKKHNKIFKKVPKPSNGDPIFKKVIYKLISKASRDLSHVFFAKKSIKYYAPSEEILRIRNHGTHTIKGDSQEGFEKKDFSILDLHKMIDFFKQSIEKHPEWNEVYKFTFSDTSEYSNISKFYREVEEQGYKISYQDVGESYIHEKVEKGELFLFQIYNKDFSDNKKPGGTDNLHTLFWKGLFSEENLKDVVLKLNGEAEIFFRPASLKRKVTHPKGQAIKNKNTLNPKEYSTFNYDLVKDRRYTQDKFFFHVPITLNFKAYGSDNLNFKVNETLKNNKDINIIGIDRGERNLLYYTLIDQNGKILEQKDFNMIGNARIETDYHNLLDKKEKERALSRFSWGSIENIKELKAGYLSHVVHHLVKLAIDKDAIICLEDLNFGFKRGRFKFEKQVYQKFERALIEKLNYLVLKDEKNGKCGYYLKAYQLTNKFISFKKLGHQSGILFYVPAYHTSKICPLTGFVNLLYPRYNNVKESQKFFGKFDKICYNQDKDYFEFHFDYKKFGTKKIGQKTKWTLCSYGNKRYIYNAKDKKMESINLTKELKTLFKKYDIDISTLDLKREIQANNKKDFHFNLMKCLKILLQVRHSNKATGDDFILSPVADENGNFFDSSHPQEVENNMPKDADANGAYHIALKGLYYLRKINHWNTKDELKLTMTNQDWYNFVQSKEYKKH